MGDKRQMCTGYTKHHIHALVGNMQIANANGAPCTIKIESAFVCCAPSDHTYWLYWSIHTLLHVAQLPNTSVRGFGIVCCVVLLVCVCESRTQMSHARSCAHDNANLREKLLGRTRAPLRTVCLFVFCVCLWIQCI